MQAQLAREAGIMPAGSAVIPGGDRGTAIVGEITVQVLRESFPQWRIFSHSGAWWAVRGGPVRLDGPESLLRRAITARDLAGLAEKLCLQERLDRLDPQELAAVHRDMTLPYAPG